METMPDAKSRHLLAFLYKSLDVSAEVEKTVFMSAAGFNVF